MQKKLYICTRKGLTKTNTTMETMTIRYNPANAVVMAAIELIKNIKAIKIVNDSRTEYVPNAATLAAAEEAKQGNLKSYSNVQDLMNDILK